MLAGPLQKKNCYTGMRSKASSFTLGVCGLRVCSLDVAFASATVRVRALWPCMPMESAAKVVTFESFHHAAASFRLACVALCDIPTCFIISQLVLCDMRDAIAGCSEDGLHFSAALWRRSSSCCVAGGALWTCRVACFFASGNVRAASSQVVTTYKFFGRPGIL